MHPMDEVETVRLVCRRFALPGTLVSDEYARASRFREICQDYVTTIQAWVWWSVLDSSCARQIEVDYWETLQALEAEMRSYLAHLQQVDSNKIKGESRQ